MRSAAAALAIGAGTMKTAARCAANQAARERSLARSQAREDQKRQRRIDGLEWLLNKKKLNLRQFKAGRRYGVLERVSRIEGAAAIKSSLANIDYIRGTAEGGFAPEILDPSEWILECRERLDEAHHILGDDPALIGMLFCICGRGDTPREVLGPDCTDREAEDLISSLRVALQILARKWEI